MCHEKFVVIVAMLGARLSIVRISILDIGDECSGFYVPSLEISTCKLHQVVTWFREHARDILLGDVSLALVVGAAELSATLS